MVSRTKAFASNAIWSLILQVVTVVSGFLVPRAIIGAYGSQMNGLVTSLTQMVSYITLVEAGISAAAIFALYNPLANNSIKDISLVVSAAKRFYYKSGIAFVVLAVILAIIYPFLVDCYPLNNWQVALLVMALCATGFLDFFTLAKYRVLLTADQRNWVIQIASIIYRILYIIVILILTELRLSLTTVYIAAIVPILIRTIILIVYARRRYPEINFNAFSDGYKLPQRWDAFVLEILGVVRAGFPILVVTFLLRDLAVVSIFSVYMLVANGIKNLCSTVTHGTQASFGDVITRNDYDTLRRTYSEMGSMMGILNASASGTAIILILPFIQLYTGDIADIDYYAPMLGLLVMIDTFLYHLKTPEGLLVIAAGKYKESRPFVIAQTTILIVGTISGAYFGGVEGVVLGDCLANIYAAAYLIYFIPNRVTKTKKINTLKKYVITVLAFIPAIAISALNVLHSENWGIWIIQAVIVAICSIVWAVAVFVAFDRKSTIAVFKRAQRLLHKN